MRRTFIKRIKQLLFTPDFPVNLFSFVCYYVMISWYRVERRQTVIKAHELAPWFQAVMNLKNDIKSQNRETIRDYLRAEPMIRSYKDEHVDFGGAGITVVNQAL